MSAVPIEIWERIIDHLHDSLDALASCALVCKAWLPRTQYCLFTRSTLWDKKQVYGFARLVREGAVSPATLPDNVSVEGDPRCQRRIPHLSAFAAMFAGRMPRLDQLQLVDAEWRRTDIHPDVFLHLADFTSVANISLTHVSFPTPAVLGRLVSSFYNLQSLQISDINFKERGRRLGPYVHPTNVPYSSLAYVYLGGTGWDDAADFIIANSRAVEMLTLPAMAFRASAMMAYRMHLLLSTTGVSDISIQVMSNDSGRPMLTEDEFLGPHLLTTTLEHISLECGECFVIVPNLLDQLSSPTIESIRLSITIDHHANAAPHEFYASSRIEIWQRTCPKIEEALSDAQYPGLETLVIDCQAIPRNEEEHILSDAQWAELILVHLHRLRLRRLDVRVFVNGSVFHMA